MSISLEGKSIFVLEDQSSPSLKFDATFEGAGCGRLSTFHHCNIAELWLEHFTPDLAVLNVGQRSDEWQNVAVMLLERDVPLVVCTDDRLSAVQTMSTLASHEWITRETPPDAILAALGQAMSVINPAKARELDAANGNRRTQEIS